ncbi:hypothetical protein [Marinobacter sp.]|uniref:hypothetical protein n=1 Tax=Marinobacter sp. TaxID=50741 RepID=UPI0019872444|nr:hypothetical protein [Marinobacter sp.]MBD3655512.1 hypothetical protein [Marinobacter sp.]
MKQPTTYAEFLTVAASIDAQSPVEAVEAAVAKAEALPHWFDRQRAITALAKRVKVDEALLFRMMTRGRV